MIAPAWIAGQPWYGDGAQVVRDGVVVGEHAVPDAAAVERAVAAAAAVRAEAAALPASARAAALTHVSQTIERRADEFAALITAENGKPLRWAQAEVGRAVSTFRWAAEEARRFAGELQRLDTDPATPGRMAVVRRFPRGPVLGIAPFNFPLNLVAHKVAPAIAVGAPIVVKPAPATPLTALLLGEVLAQTDLPAGMWSVLPVGNEVTAALAADERLPVVSFTGSDKVGYAIEAANPHKHMVLELGGNAAAVVLADWPDLEWAAQRIAMFGNYQAGQSCISVQRVFVEESIRDRFEPLLVAAVSALDFEDVVGPVINEAAADRISGWVAEAVASGARLLVGGDRRGTAVSPTLLADVPLDAKVCSEEVFGPVLVLTSVPDAGAAFAAVNDSRFGLQAGVFTRDIATAFRAHAELEVGGVIIGDVPSYRADQMPYGGVKASGVGREGLRSAMQDLTYEKVLVLTGLTL